MTADDMKKLMADALAAKIEQLGQTQTHIARVHCIYQSHLSKVTTGRVDGISLEKLVGIGEKLGVTFTLTVSQPEPPASKEVF